MEAEANVCRITRGDGEYSSGEFHDTRIRAVGGITCANSNPLQDKEEL